MWSLLHVVKMLRGFMGYNAKEVSKVKVEVEMDTKWIAADPYSSAINGKNFYFIEWKITGHIPRKISC